MLTLIVLTAVVQKITIEVTNIANSHPMMIAFQGEPGSYSDKAARELLGPSIITLPKQSFEEVFNAAYFGEADYCVVPIENSLGGSIHTNYDLILRYDLHIIAEHELRAEHSLLASPEVSEDWDNNFTRFLLLACQPVSSQIPPQMAAKTSIVFVLENTPSALCKALACFSLRDIGMPQMF